MTPLSRGIISSGKLGVIGPPLFPVSMADMNGSSMWVSGTKSASLQALNGSQTWSTRVKFNVTVTGSLVAIMTLHSDAFNVRSSRLYLTSLGEFKGVNYETVDDTTEVGLTSSFGVLSTSIWYHLVFRVNHSTNDFDIFINNSKTSGTVAGSTTDDGGNAYGIGLGNAGSLISKLDGSQGITRVWDRALSDAEVTEDFNGAADEYICYDNLSAGLLSGLLFDSDLGNFDGGSTPLAEHTGNSTLTNNGSIPFTGSGLMVECT